MRAGFLPLPSSAPSTTKPMANNTANTTLTINPIVIPAAICSDCDLSANSWFSTAEILVMANTDRMTATTSIAAHR